METVQWDLPLEFCSLSVKEWQLEYPVTVESGHLGEEWKRCWSLGTGHRDNCYYLSMVTISGVFIFYFKYNNLPVSQQDQVWRMFKIIMQQLLESHWFPNIGMVKSKWISIQINYYRFCIIGSLAEYMVVLLKDFFFRFVEAKIEFCAKVPGWLLLLIQ